MNNQWSDEQVERLKALWADGYSCSQIAAELGGFTPNAIIGKIHRLGLPRPGHKRPQVRRRDAPTAAPKPKSDNGSGAVQAIRRRQEQQKAIASRAPVDRELEVEVVLPELVDDVIPVSQRCGLLDLTSDTCRWPIGHPRSADFFFCGGQTVTKLPYCAHHARVAYQFNPARSRSHA